MNNNEKRIIEKITEALNQILSGKKTEPIQCENSPQSLGILIRKTNEVICFFSEILDFILPLSKGLLNENLPQGSNPLVFLFKEFHTHLRKFKNGVHEIKSGVNGGIHELETGVHEGVHELKSEVHGLGESHVLKDTKNTGCNEDKKQKYESNEDEMQEEVQVTEYKEKEGDGIADKYRMLLENARDIILFISPDGYILEANKAAIDAYGYSRDELLSLKIFDLHNENNSLVIEQYLNESNHSGITYETVNLRRDGSTFPVEVSSQSVIIGDQQILVQIIRDITDRKRVEENLRYFASYDALTGIPNRRVLEETYNEMFGPASDISFMKRTGALILIDIDNFKFINDTFGHTVGDMVLVNLVSILKRNLRNDDLLARFGGDEFCVLLKNVNVQQANIIVEKLRRAVEQSRVLLGESDISFGYTISVGVAPILGGMLEFQEIISRADYALYQSKENGRNRVSCISNEQISKDKLVETNNMIFLINEALNTNRIVLYFQPIVEISTGKVIHHEALIRILTKTGEIIYPGKTLPIAERFGLMPLIDRQVLKLSFEALEKYPELKLFINLSGASIGDDSIVSMIEENINRRKFDPSRLGFEIAETLAMKDFARAELWIKQLRQKGCRFALDDFGAGFSSFSYLQYLSVDYVKIDGSYIRDLDRNYKNRALVQAINIVAHSFGKKVIAEFVENSSILNILSQDKVNYGQGYYLGHPEPVPKFESIPVYIEGNKKVRVEENKKAEKNKKVDKR
ncbi:MAG TPA: EAL domain-containing protein [Clostridiaceae bacterium]|nr:EAL domain-containing protein [Clostridiaceae bacterium]